MQAEGLGKLCVRLLTSDFEEAVAARAENPAPRPTRSDRRLFIE